MNGVKYSPNPNPPDFVAVPWNTWTYENTGEITSSGGPAVVVPFATKALAVAEQISAALGSSVAPEIKILRASAWITASQTNQLVAPTGTTTFYELAGDATANSKRETISDRGTLNMPATFGYVYPKVDQKEIIDATSEDRNILATTSDSPALQPGSTDRTLAVTHRVHVLWRPKNNLFVAVE
jgi:hypothetical protein